MAARHFRHDRGCLVGIVGAPGLGKSRLISEFAAIAASQGADVVLPGVNLTPARSRFARCHACCAPCSRWTASATPRPVITRRPSARAARFALCRRADPVRDHGHRRHQCTSTAGQCRWPTPPAGRGDVAGRPGTLGPDVFVLEDAHWIDAPSDDVLAAFAATLGMTDVDVRHDLPAGVRRRAAPSFGPDDHAAATVRFDGCAPRRPTSRGTTHHWRVWPSGSQLWRWATRSSSRRSFVTLAGRGVLSGSRGGYRLMGDIDEIAVPATVQAVLAARIDRLPAETKSILNAAAVIGTHFDVDTLRALLPESRVRTFGRAGVGRVDRSDGICSATTVLLPPSTGPHGGLRITVERHPCAGPQQAGRRH